MPAYTPPKIGATTRPIPKEPAPIPIKTAFFPGGAIVMSIVRPLLATPAAPMPAMARPPMKALLVGAAAHKMLPMRKMKEKDR